MTPLPAESLKDKTILLVISGGIAAYKSLELIRLLRKQGAQVRGILTAGGARFITDLSVASLTEHHCYTDLWSLKDETEMGHIRLSREADLIVIAPASANMIAKMAHGNTDDLASTMLLAADKKILLAPAMNHMMWKHPATQENMTKLRARGVMVTGPDEGDMACGEYGPGRMSEPTVICKAIMQYFADEQKTKKRPLAGKTALVTSGPTYESLDPVRFIGNRSSGKQGHAIARALVQAGAHVTLVTGPVALEDPAGARTIHVETAAEMLAACLQVLPTDIAVCAAAVSDWRPVTTSTQKIKKQNREKPPAIILQENPDILATIAQHPQMRPALVVGFAAETQDMLTAAMKKRQSKGCDWIVANDVAADNIFGADQNRVTLVTQDGQAPWEMAGKDEVARRLVAAITAHFDPPGHENATE